MPNLTNISITINTHNFDASVEPIAHIFIKNRSNTSSTPEGDVSFIANQLAYESAESANGYDVNPYLGRLIGTTITAPTVTLTVKLRSQPIPTQEVILPVVNIHLLPPEGFTGWIFDYQVTFQFDSPDPAIPPLTFSASSDINGIAGIVLDGNNRDHSGICTENPFIPPPLFLVPPTDSSLYQITVDFYTPDGNSKPPDMQLNLHIVNRQSNSSSQDLLIAADLFPNQEFAAKSLHSIAFPNTANALSANPIRFADIVLPMATITIASAVDVEWVFNFRVGYFFTGQKTFYSTHTSIVLNPDNYQCSHVYQGDPFPTETPPPQAALSPSPDTNSVRTKTIPISFLQSKVKEFINDRQGLLSDSPSPALRRLRFDNSGKYGVLPDNYYDLQSINANPPTPGTVVAVGYQEPVDWTSSPTTLGQFSGAHGLEDAFLNDINSNSINVTVDGTNETPLSVLITFETTGPQEVTGYGSLSAAGMHLSEFSINIKLTLTHNPGSTIIDLMSWLDLPNLDDLGYVTVIATAGETGGAFQTKVRTQIYNALRTPDPFTGLTPRDSINSLANSLLLGGVVDGGVHPENNCQVQSLLVTGDNIQITYTGPQNAFQLQPGSWPSGIDMSEGALANIDHIVVLTMENRSFDQMLGYLSLPPEKGGMGRTDVDGLKGDEFNLLDGVSYPSFAFDAGDTIFSPDPPHSYEPVQKAINNGRMDGFVSSYKEQRGAKVAPRIMGYHTGVNVPTYDALAKDFSICHRWFAPHPGPTFCNRFHELSGRLNIDPDGFWELSNSSSLKPAFTPTVFDYLSDPKYLKDPTTTWKYFEHGYCFLRFFEKYTYDATNIVSFNDPIFGFVNLAQTGNLPSVSYIDPHFIELPPGGNCDGPPADVAQGQLLVQTVVNAVVTSPNWSKTLLIVTYDEHGGFFDHVPPPAAAQIAPGLPNTFGVRVPAFVISPWMAGGGVFGQDATSDGTGKSLYFDHTSILKTIARRFMSDNPPYMGARYAAANDLSMVLSTEMRSGPFRPFIPYTLTYGSSKKCLDVILDQLAPGTLLWQYDPNGTTAQQFSFEDGGGGYFYIRTTTGGFYVTVDAGSDPNASQHGIKLDLRYFASSGQNPDYQRWSVHLPQALFEGQLEGTIRNAAFNGMVLHPLGESVDSEAKVVLETETVSLFSPTSVPYPWIITNPLLSGGITNAPRPPAPSVFASPAAISFPSQFIATQSTEFTTTVTTQGALTITGIALTDGVGAASQDYNCFPAPRTPPIGGNISIPANGQLIVSAWFHPTAAGQRTGQIELTHDAPGSPLVIPLSGLGDPKPIPLLSLSQSSISFSNKKIVNSLVTLTNTGAAPLMITDMSVDNPSFTFGNTCGVGPGTTAVLQPGQQCTVRVACKFDKSDGDGTLSITHNAPGSPAEIDLDYVNSAKGPQH